jgi:hypothetical protein
MTLELAFLTLSMPAFGLQRRRENGGCEAGHVPPASLPRQPISRGADKFNLSTRTMQLLPMICLEWVWREMGVTFANLCPVTLHVPLLPFEHSSRKQFFKKGSAFCIKMGHREGHCNIVNNDFFFTASFRLTYVL